MSNTFAHVWVSSCVMCDAMDKYKYKIWFSLLLYVGAGGAK